MNLYVFSGRLTRDVETKVTQSGKPVASFSVAVESGWGDNKKVMYPRCTLWGKRAEGGLIQYLTKGAQVLISGEPSENEFESNGVTKKSLEVNVGELDLIGGKQNSSPGQSQGAQQINANKPVDDGDFDSIPF